jgi:hypothetical protein
MVPVTAVVVQTAAVVIIIAIVETDCRKWFHYQGYCFLVLFYYMNTQQ